MWIYEKVDKRHKVINEYITNKISQTQEKLNKVPLLTLEAISEILNELNSSLDEVEENSEKHQVNNSFFDYADKVVERKASSLSEKEVSITIKGAH